MRDFQLPGKSMAFAANGMCATSHPLAARTAVRILEDGGNAVDAAIAGAVLLGLCEPQSTGIGGDCFVLIKPPGKERIVSLNGSGKAPVALDAESLRHRGLSSIPENGPEAVTVPGAIDAFCRLSQDWGRLGLEAILRPAIHYAEAGVPVAPRVSSDWAAAADGLQGRARDFYLLNGRPPELGCLFRHSGQAEVLRRIAGQGRDGFYTGEVASDMVKSLAEMGGVHTLEDFATTSCEYTEPIRGEYGDFTIVEHPPNGQGATAILLANMLSCFDIQSMEPFGSERAHIEAEAAKLAIDARDRFIADPLHTTRLDHLLSKETAIRLASLIDPNSAIRSARNSSESVHKDTVLLVAVDSDRMMVSLIYSVFHSFGSGLASTRFGINFHNRGSSFNLEKGHPNEAGGGKRPMHTILPAMLERDGKAVMAFGVMGAHYQAIGHARFISNLVDFGMDLQEALDGPRIFPTQGVLEVERGYALKVRHELSSLGHKVTKPSRPVGGGQAISVDYQAGILCGASDCRKDGCAMGY